MTKSKVYTTTGDNGATSLVGGVRVKKTDIRIEAYGSIDELNANIGVLLAIPCLQPAAVDLLHQVQNRLFSIGAYLATPNPDNAITRCAGLSAENVEAIENVIDHFDAQLPPLNNFVLPGGTHRAARRNTSLGSRSRVPHNVPPLRAPYRGSGRPDICRP